MNRIWNRETARFYPVNPVHLVKLQCFDCIVPPKGALLRNPFETDWFSFSRARELAPDKNPIS